VLASGPAAAVERVRPLLERLGQRLFVIGAKQRAKLSRFRG
jgi:3-hydroxyisobutyrate dehydrogenase-like beta-hydroxyacid dehydrogenase